MQKFILNLMWRRDERHQAPLLAAGFKGPKAFSDSESGMAGPTESVGSPPFQCFMASTGQNESVAGPLSSVGGPPELPGTRTSTGFAEVLIRC